MPDLSQIIGLLAFPGQEPPKGLLGGMEQQKAVAGLLGQPIQQANPGPSLSALAQALMPDYLRTPPLTDVQPGTVGKVPSNQPMYVDNPLGAATMLGMDALGGSLKMGAAAATNLPLMAMAGMAGNRNWRASVEAAAKKLRAAGYTVDVEKSRQSPSTYLYIEENYDTHQLAPGADPGMYTVRVSDHMNPAYKPTRVSSGNDRAFPARAEFRVDRGKIVADDIIQRVLKEHPIIPLKE